MTSKSTADPAFPRAEAHKLSLYAQLTAPESLASGWERVRERSPMPGGDGIDVAAWAISADTRLARLRNDLLLGTYRPGPVRRFAIARTHGGEPRPLGLLCVADRIVQSAALLLLTPLFEAAFEDGSFGYRPGRSVKAAAARISSHYRQGFRFAIEADIVGYFEAIPHRQLLKDLAALVPDPQLNWLFAQWLDLAGTGDTGLVQGAPISPLFANLYLDRIDEAVAAHGARIVRFADDFVILTKSRDKAERELVTRI